MTIYDYVKALASERDVDIKTVETACQFGNGTIQKWSASVPKVDKLYRVALYFNVPIEYFLTGFRPVHDTKEQLLIDAYRMADDEGQMNIIYVCMDEKRKAEAKRENIAAV